MRKIKNAVSIILCCLLLFNLSACGKDFDAQGYTYALLDQLFQGEVDELAKFEKQTGKKELEDQYENYISTFSESLVSGLNVSDEMSRKFYKLCEEIFRAAKYNVTDTTKISKDKFKVSVEIRPMDIFVTWRESMEESVKTINKKFENGEYQGTDAEIVQLMLFDIAAESYELLETAYQEVQYREPEIVVLTIEKNKNRKFEANEEEISGLITKILCLDAIQD